MDRLGRPLLGRSPSRGLIPAIRPPFLRRRTLIVAAASAFLAGCGAATAETPGLPPDPEALAAALSTGDRDAFLSRFTSDPAGRALGELLWRNWQILRVQVEGTPDGLMLKWGVPQERDGTRDAVRTEVRDGLVAAMAPAGIREPIWLRQPLDLVTTDRASVVFALGVQAVQGWAEDASAAARILAGAGLEPAARNWDGVLAVELPSTLDVFRRVSGLSSSLAAVTGAVTTMADVNAAPRIVGNVLTAVASMRRTLLVHEGVHAAVRSPVLDAPGWLVEGIAESVASSSDPQTRSSNAALVRGGARPTALPAQDDLNGPEAARAYALASLAVEAAIGRWGRPAVMGWLADWRKVTRPSEDELTRTYLAALP